VFVSPRYSEAEARAAIEASHTWTGALRLLGRCPTGGAPGVLKKWAGKWNIPTDHFDPNLARSAAAAARRTPIVEQLTENSTVNRQQLKRALYREGLKDRECELCGQGEMWNGTRISLILDHINGVRDDNRIENLRIVCPNCAATLETHCGRKNRLEPSERVCLHCGSTFRARKPRQRYCSRACGTRAPSSNRGVPNPALRRVERPPYEQLVREIAETSYLAVGRRYGVSDNAVRKWVLQYRREEEAAMRDP
jgi:ferredoxin